MRPIQIAAVAALGATVALAAPACAQQPETKQQPAAGALQAQPSTRATVEVALSRGRGTPVQKIAIEYGQPHSRGRQTPGTVDPYDKVWRFGANSATILTTDVDLTIGNANVPKGKYSLYALPSQGGWKLIINQNTGQWGTEYDQSKDLARVDVRSQTLQTPLESFTVWMIPAGDGAPRGELRFGWGTMAFSTTWAAK